MALPPRPGFGLAWSGECYPEPGRRTDREFASALDVLDAIESTSATQLPNCGEWNPITADLLTRVRDGLQGS